MKMKTSVNDKIGGKLDITVEEQKMPEVVSPTEVSTISNASEFERDYTWTRENIMGLIQTGQNSLANGELNPIYSNGMEEITSPNTGFTEQKGAFDIGLLVAFPIMIGTLGFFLFFPYVAPQLAANSP